MDPAPPADGPPPPAAAAVTVPPPDIRDCVNKTAYFVAKNGTDFEERIIARDIRDCVKPARSELSKPEEKENSQMDPYFLSHLFLTDVEVEGTNEEVGTNEDSLSWTSGTSGMSSIDYSEFLPDVSCIKLSPVRSDEQEDEDEDEDNFSTTSTIDYSYSEEEDNRDEDSIPSEEEDSIPSEEEDSIPSEEEDDRDEDSIPSEEEDSIPSEVNKEDESSTTKETYYDFSKPVSRWIDSWKRSDERRDPIWTWINVYAYFNKDKGYGGYGVIIRNARAVPVIASAKFSKIGISFYYQVYKGINAGVALAERRGLSNLHVECNSHKVPNLFRQVHVCSKCADGGNICKICYNRIMYYDRENCDMRLVLPLILELRNKNLGSLFSSWGIAAHIVAKMDKKKMLEVEETFATNDDGSGEIEREIKPECFPLRLKTILWRDSFIMSRVGPWKPNNYTKLM